MNFATILGLVIAGAGLLLDGTEYLFPGALSRLPRTSRKGVLATGLILMVAGAVALGFGLTVFRGQGSARPNPVAASDNSVAVHDNNKVANARDVDQHSLTTGPQYANTIYNGSVEIRNRELSGRHPQTSNLSAREQREQSVNVTNSPGSIIAPSGGNNIEINE